MPEAQSLSFLLDTYNLIVLSKFQTLIYFPRIIQSVFLSRNFTSGNRHAEEFGTSTMQAWGERQTLEVNS